MATIEMTEATRDQRVFEQWKALMREDFRTKETVASMEPMMGVIAGMLGMDASGQLDPRDVLNIIEAVVDNYTLAADGVDDDQAAAEAKV